MDETEVELEILPWERERMMRSTQLKTRRLTRERICPPFKKLTREGIPHGNMPKYVQLHVQALEVSPLREAVFSAGRKKDQKRVQNKQPISSTPLAYKSQAYQEGTLAGHTGCGAKRLRRRGKEILPPDQSFFSIGKKAHTNASKGCGLSSWCCKRRSDSSDYHPVDVQGEKLLLEELTLLTAARHDDCRNPTVTALKKAVAINEVHEKLRQYKKERGMRLVEKNSEDLIGISQADTIDKARKRVVNEGQLEGGLTLNINRQVPSNRREPWDNHTPFTTSNLAKVTSPKSAAVSKPSLRQMTKSDPTGMFGDAKQLLQPHQNNPSSSVANFPESLCTPTAEGRKHAPQDCLEVCLQGLTISTLTELHHLKCPPQPVLKTLEALCCLLGGKPGWGPRQRSLLSNAHVLWNTLASIRCDRIPASRMADLAKRLDSGGMTPSAVKAASSAAFPLFQWLTAVREKGWPRPTSPAATQHCCDMIEQKKDRQLSSPDT